MVTYVGTSGLKSPLAPLCERGIGGIWDDEVGHAVEEPIHYRWPTKSSSGEGRGRTCCLVGQKARGSPGSCEA